MIYLADSNKSTIAIKNDVARSDAPRKINIESIGFHFDAFFCISVMMAARISSRSPLRSISSILLEPCLLSSSLAEGIVSATDPKNPEIRETHVGDHTHATKQPKIINEIVIATYNRVWLTKESFTPAAYPLQAYGSLTISFLSKLIIMRRPQASATRAMVSNWGTRCGRRLSIRATTG